MNRRGQSITPCFREYSQLLLELHRLIRRGMGDEDEADAVRDKMDAPWLKLSESEVEQVRGLSTDLACLDDSERRPTSISKTETKGVFESAFESENWIDALSALRHRSWIANEADVAFLQGVCWAHLQAPDIAIEFFEFARDSGRFDASRQIWLLTCYILAGRLEDAIPAAEHIGRTEVNPLLLLKASEVFSMRASELRDEEARDLRMRAIELAERGLEMLDQSNVVDEMAQGMRVTSLLHLALDFEAIGEMDRAQQACELAIRAAPDNPNAVMLRGWLNRLREPEAALGDFRQAFNRRLALGAGLLDTTPVHHESN